MSESVEFKPLRPGERDALRVIKLAVVDGSGAVNNTTVLMQDLPDIYMRLLEMHIGLLEAFASQAGIPVNLFFGQVVKDRLAAAGETEL